MPSTCPACGAPAMRRWRLATASDPQLAAHRTYELDRCAASAAPRSRSTAARRSAPLYEGGTYAAERRAFAPLLAPLRRLAERDRLRFLASVPQGARVLEVGAGDGRFVATLAAAGFEAHGIEPSPRACEAAARIGARSSTRAPRRPPSTRAQDAVVFWHALEHTADPGAVAARGSASGSRPAAG